MYYTCIMYYMASISNRRNKREPITVIDAI